MTKIPHSENELKRALPYAAPRGHAVGGVESGATIIHSPAAVAINPTAGLPKRTSTEAPPVHQSMANNGGNRGHAVSKSIPTAAQLLSVQGSDATKRVDLPPLHSGARGRDLTSDPTYRGPSYDPSAGDAVLDESEGSRHLPGAVHHSHTSNMRRK
jgi:hypothetical protein